MGFRFLTTGRMFERRRLERGGLLCDAAAGRLLSALSRGCFLAVSTLKRNHTL